MSVLQEVVALAVDTVGPEGTVRALATELIIVQAQLAGFKDMERDLRNLIAEVTGYSEGGVQ